MHAAAWMLALGYWRRRFGRAALTLLGVTAGLTLLGAVLLVNDALLRTYQGWSRGAQGFTALEVRALAERGFKQSWLGQIGQVSGVRLAAPSLERRSYLFRDGAQVPVVVRGVEPALEERLRPLSMLVGRALEPGDAHVTLLSSAAALALQAAPGSDVQLLTPEGVQSLRVVGVYHPGAGSTAPSEQALLVSLQEAQALFEQGRDLVTHVDVATAAGPIEAVQQQLTGLLGSVATVRRPQQAAVQLAAASAGLRSMLLLAGLLAVVAATALTYVHARAMHDERRAELLTLHQLGVPLRRLRRWRRLEVAGLVTLGALPAALLVLPTAQVILGQLPEQLRPFATAVAAPRASAGWFLLPAAGWLAVGATLLLLAAALLERLFRRLARRMSVARQRAWLRLAGDQLRRRARPHAVVASAVALTLAGLVAIEGSADRSRRSLSTWLDGAITWDLRVAAAPTAASSVTLPAGAVQQVAALPGVDTVATERQVRVASRGRGLTIIALGGSGPGLASRLRVVQAADLSGSAVLADLQRGRSLALSVPLADRLELSVGSSLPLVTAAGEEEYMVVALVDDAASREEAAYMWADSYADTFADDGIDAMTIRLAPGARAAELAGAVRQQEQAMVPLHVTLADAYRTDLLTDASLTYRAARLLVLLAVVVALLAQLAGGVAGAWQAGAETAALRAQGVSRRLLLQVLGAGPLISAAVAALVGAALGTLLAVPLPRALGAAPRAWQWPTSAYWAVGGLFCLTVGAALLMLAPLTGLNPPRGRRR